MSLKYSTGFRNAQVSSVLGTGAADPIMAGCVLMMYAGSTPPDADAALGDAVLLATYSVNDDGTPLAWEAPAGGSASKVAGDMWRATAVATGTPKFFRYQDPDDDGELSTTAVRIQGKVGLLSDPEVDLALSSLAVVSGAPLAIDSASATVPSQN
jgi:hypothetical protein